MTTSRPGYGDSTRQPGRSVADVAADTAAVLAAIGAERCLVMDGSGGGPHALACAARLAAAAAVLVLAGLAPYDADGLDWMAGMGEDNGFSAALQGEDELRAYLLQQREQLKDVTGADIVAAFGEAELSDSDRVALTGELGEDFAANFREGLRTGVEGWVDDCLALTRLWGFDLEEISVPVMIWHGTADPSVPVAHGQWLASRIPGARAHFEEGEGHYSVAFSALDRKLDELVTAGSEANAFRQGSAATTGVIAAGVTVRAGAKWRPFPASGLGGLPPPRLHDSHNGRVRLPLIGKSEPYTGRPE